MRALRADQIAGVGERASPMAAVDRAPRVAPGRVGRGEQGELDHEVERAPGQEAVSQLAERQRDPPMRAIAAARPAEDCAVPYWITGSW